MKGEVKISKASYYDHEKIRDFYEAMTGPVTLGKRYSVDDWGQLTESKNSHIFMATVDKKVVGMILWYDMVRWTYVDVLIVAPNHRRMGIGTKLMDTTKSQYRPCVEMCHDSADREMGYFLRSLGAGDEGTGITIWKELLLPKEE